LAVAPEAFMLRHMSRILIAEDDLRFSDRLERGLRAAGFSTTVCHDGIRCASIARDDDFDLLLLDTGLRGQDGFAVLRAIRARGERMPVMVVTASDDVDDTITALDSGADDYIAEPFAFEELLARVRAQLRASAFGDTSLELHSDGVRLDVRARRAEIDGEAVELTGQECALLETFLRHPGEALSREQLLSAVWGYDFDPSSNVVDVYVGYLRRKLGPERLETVRGIGYKLVP
jgi:DNA-binding response OmpR family regulator